MAIVSAWTADLPANQIPTGVTVPSVDAPEGDPIYRADFDIEVAGSLDNANLVTAFGAVGDAVKTAWDANYDTAKLGLDAAANITVRIVITSILRGMSEFEHGDRINQFGVGTDVFKCNGYAEWAVDPA